MNQEPTPKFKLELDKDMDQLKENLSEILEGNIEKEDMENLCRSVFYLACRVQLVEELFMKSILPSNSLNPILQEVLEEGEKYSKISNKITPKENKLN